MYEETFEKSCQITFKQQAFNKTVEKCYTLVTKKLTHLDVMRKLCKVELLNAYKAIQQLHLT